MSTNAIEVLLVEDDPDDACLTIRALRKHKLAENVELVTDGAQALDFLFSKGDYVAREANSPPPKVVFLDLKLPKVNGLEVLRELKADARLRMIPVVVLTSSSEDRDCVRHINSVSTAISSSPSTSRNSSRPSGNSASIGFL